MEKKSRYYLSENAAQQVGDLPWQPNSDRGSSHFRRAAFEYAEHRKIQLTRLQDLSVARGLGASLKRLKQQVDIKVHGFMAKASVGVFNDNLSDVEASINYHNLFQVDRIVAGDVGRIGVH